MFKHRILQIAAERPIPSRWLIIDASAINHLDITAVDALDEVRTALEERGIVLGIAELHRRPRIWSSDRVSQDQIGRSMIFKSTEAAVASFETTHVTKEG